jgi:TP901 family phage tail tape measure protein
VAINSVDIHLNAFANFSPVFAEVTKLKAVMADMQSSSFGSTLSSDYVSGLQKAQQQFTNLVQSTRAFNVQSVQMADSVSQFSKHLEAGQLKLGQYYGIWKENAKGVSTQLDSLATQQARVARSVVVPDALHAGYAQVITDLNGVVTNTEKAAFYQTAYNTTLRDGANKLIDFGKNMQWAGRQLTVGLTVPMALFANQAAQSYLSFDKAMTDMLKVYGSQAVVQSQQALDTIRTEVTDLATNLAHTIGVTMTDTVKIAQTFSQMGLTGQDLLKTTDATAKLMKLGGLTAEGSAQAAIAMQNVFKLQSNQMADAINFLNAAKHSTSTSMQDIVEALPKVGPIITQMGGTYKDFATMLVALRENGVPASQAANTIKSMFATLINPTTKAINEFNNLGISLKGIVSQDANNPLKMLEDLKVALDKLPSTERTRAIEQLFGKFQFARADALISSLGAAGSQNEKVMQLYNSSNAELAAVAQQELDIASKGTPAAQYAKMKASLQADLIPIGREFLVVMTKIGNVVDGIVKWVDKLGSFKGVLLGGLAVVGLIGPLVMFAGLFSNLVGTIFKGFNYIRMFKEGFNQATETGPLQRFAAGLKNMSNFYHEVDVSALAASHSTDLMELSAQNSAKAFDVLATAIRNLTTQISALNAVSVNPTGLASELKSTIQNAGMAAKAATGAAQMELPLMLADGGYVPGVGNSDSQPAFLTPGEAVIPKDKARKYAPFINAMINGTVGTFNGGLPAEASKNTNFTHLALTQEGGIQYLASELLAIYKDGGMKLTQLGLKIIEELASKETQMVAGLVAKGYSEIEAQGMLPKFAGLGSLGFTLDAKLNNQMGKPGGASTQAVAQDFEAQGLAKWNKSLQKAGLVTDSYTELSEEMQSQLKQLDSSILAEIKSHKGLTIRDTDLTTSYIKIQDTIPELSASQSRLIREFNTLAFTLTDWRTRFSGTEEAFIAGGYNVEDHAKASGSSYKQIKIAGSPKRLGSQNNALGAGLVPSPEIIQEQMAAWEAMTEGQLSTTIAKIEEFLTVKLSSAVDNSVMAALGSGREAAGIASPARLFREKLGMPIGDGTAAGISDSIPAVEKAATASVEAATAATKKSLQMELPLAQENIKEFSAKLWVPSEEQAAAAGTASAEAYTAGVAEGLAGSTGNSVTETLAPSIMGRLSNSKFAMGGGALMASMFAPMLINMLPNSVGGANMSGAKTFASDVASSAGMGAMVGTMGIPGIGTGVGAAVGALVGLYQGVTALTNQKAADLQAKINQQITAQGNTLLKSSLGVGTALNNLLIFAKGSLNNLDKGGSGSGSDSSNAYILGHSGGNIFTKAINNIKDLPGNIFGGIFSMGAAGSKAGAASSGINQSTQLAFDPSLTYQAKGWSDLTNSQRAVGQGLASAFEVMQSGSGTLSQYNDMLKAINTQTNGNHNATAAFASALTQAGGVMNQTYDAVRTKIDLSTTSSSQLYTVLTAVSKGMDVSNLSGNNLFTKASEYIQQAFAATGDNGGQQPFLDPNAVNGVDWTKIYGPIIKKYTDIKKLIDDQANAQKKYNDQLKLTQDYQNKQMDYFNQMKNALTSGNYIQAAQAQQSALQNQANFAGQITANKQSDQAASVSNIISALQDAQANGVSLSSFNKYEGVSAPTNLTSAYTQQLLGGYSTADYNTQTRSINAQVAAAVGAAQSLAGGEAFGGVTIIQNIPISNSVISPADHLAQVASAATKAAQAAAATSSKKSNVGNKVGKSTGTSSRKTGKG